MKEIIIELNKTKKGYPAIWEMGGGYSNTGSATTITGPHGEKLKPVYIRHRGPLAYGHHALFIAKDGMVVIKANHHRGTPWNGQPDWPLEKSITEGSNGWTSFINYFVVFIYGVLFGYLWHFMAMDGFNH